MVSLFAEHKPHQREKGNPGHEKFLTSTSSDLHDVHAGLPELVGELFPDEEVEQLPGFGHHHLAASHVVQGLNEFSQMLNSEMLKNLIMIKVQEIPHHNHSGQCSPMQCFEGLDQDSGLPIGRRYH